MNGFKEWLDKCWLTISIISGICALLGTFGFALTKINTLDSNLYHLSQKTAGIDERINQLKSYGNEVKLNSAEEQYLKTKLIGVTSKIQSNTDRINKISNAYVTLSYFDRDMDIIKSDLTHQMNLIIENIKVVNQIKGYDGLRRK